MLKHTRIFQKCAQFYTDFHHECTSVTAIGSRVNVDTACKLFSYSGKYLKKQTNKKKKKKKKTR